MKKKLASLSSAGNCVAWSKRSLQKAESLNGCTARDNPDAEGGRPSPGGSGL